MKLYHTEFYSLPDSWLLGVFSSEEKAKKACLIHCVSRDTDSFGEWEREGDTLSMPFANNGYVITEIELDRAIEVE